MAWPVENQDPWYDDFIAQANVLDTKATDALANAASASALATTANASAEAASDAAAAAQTDADSAGAAAAAAQTSANDAVTTANAAAVTASGAQDAADDAVAAAATATAAADYAVAAAAAAASVKAWARNPDQLIVGAITRDSNGAITSAAVEWPDETVGVFTALELSATFPGAVDSYSITYGSPATKTYTQPTLTRDAAGSVINLPEIVVT